VSPEVHDHLHRLVGVELQVVAHHAASCDTVSLYAVSSASLIRPRTMVSSANLTSLMDEWLERQSLVYRENM